MSSDSTPGHSTPGLGGSPLLDSNFEIAADLVSDAFNSLLLITCLIIA